MVRTALERKAIKLIPLLFYVVAILVALWPLVGLVFAPGNRNHVVRFIGCWLVALVIAAVGKLLSLSYQALAVYIERNRTNGAG